jgi:hypothetical protein
MARQEHTCRRCGTHWATEDHPRTALRVIPGGAPPRPADAQRPAIAATITGNARAATGARLDADRWIDEGGSL